MCLTAGLPLFWRHPTDQIISNYQTATFECFVNGSKSVDVTWEKDGTPLFLMNRNVMKHSNNNGITSNLTLNKATVRDSGNYQCNATTVDGDSVVSIGAELISNNINKTLVFIVICFYSSTTNPYGS